MVERKTALQHKIYGTNTANMNINTANVEAEEPGSDGERRKRHGWTRETDPRTRS